MKSEKKNKKTGSEVRGTVVKKMGPGSDVQGARSFRGSTQSLSKYCLVLSTLFMLAVNIAANLVPLGGKYTYQISDQHLTFFTPAGYVFSIWGLIYILNLLLVFRIVTGRSQVGNKFIGLFSLANLANGVWLLCWHYGLVAQSSILMSIILISLLIAYKSEPHLDRFLRPALSVYLGWISVATIANYSISLSIIQWDGFGIAPQLWTVLMAMVAAALAILTYYRNKDIYFGLVVLWAIYGIGVRFQSDRAIVLGMGAAFGLILGSVATIYLLRMQKTARIT